MTLILYSLSLTLPLSFHATHVYACDALPLRCHTIGVYFICDLSQSMRLKWPKWLKWLSIILKPKEFLFRSLYVDDTVNTYTYMLWNQTMTSNTNVCTYGITLYSHTKTALPITIYTSILYTAHRFRIRRTYSIYLEVPMV